MDRKQKKEAVAHLTNVFSAASLVVVAHYAGLNVAQMQSLRRNMKQVGASVQVSKNRLAKIALRGTDAESVASLLRGPTLVAYSDDPIAAAKAAVSFAKDHERFIVLGGVMGKVSLDAAGVAALATMPSLDELRAKILGLVVAPATKLAGLINAPAGKIVRVVSAYASKSGDVS